MAAEISKSFGIKAELIQGKNGIFDVMVDGNLIFSKHESGRFPQNDEILRMLGKS
jgi:selT/selW/selH-like putative selenoprotein